MATVASWIRVVKTIVRMYVSNKIKCLSYKDKCDIRELRWLQINSFVLLVIFKKLYH